MCHHTWLSSWNYFIARHVLGTHSCMHVCLCVRAWFYMCICVHACMSVYVCLCACAWTHSCVGVYVYVQISLLTCARGGLRLMGGVVLHHPPPYSLSRLVLRLTGLLRNAPSLPLESWDYRWATMPPGIYVLGSKLRSSHSHRKCFIRSLLPNLPLRLLGEDAQTDQGSSLISDIFSLWAESSLSSPEPSVPLGAH